VHTHTHTHTRPMWRADCVRCQANHEVGESLWSAEPLLAEWCLLCAYWQGLSRPHAKGVCRIGSLATNLRSVAIWVKTSKRGTPPMEGVLNRVVRGVGYGTLGYLHGPRRDCPHFVCAHNQTPPCKIFIQFLSDPLSLGPGSLQAQVWEDCRLPAGSCRTRHHGLGQKAADEPPFFVCRRMTGST
jgi:hypothetical protein